MSGLILCGYKGVGKSTLGRQLASRLGWEFIDTDELLSSTRSCRALALEIGEEVFRRRERKAILNWKPSKPTVIATGGGALLDEVSRCHLLAFGRCVHLYLDAEQTWSRIHTPLPSFLDPQDPYKSFLAHRRERLKHYRTVTDLEVPVGVETLSTLENLIYGQQ